MKKDCPKICIRILLASVLMFFVYSSVLTSTCYGSGTRHLHSEKSYQRAWSQKNGGIVEYVNDDNTRVDCLTSTHAIEFDFANKWAESVGQALYYQYKTGKKAKVVLILENPRNQMVYYKRVQALAKIHGFDTEYVTPSILKISDSGHCQYKDCKCRK
jgi:hypothetical protein